MNLMKSKGMQERARKVIPGMTQLLSKRPDRFSDGVWPTYYDKAEGISVWDLDGNEYRDFSIGGIGANVLGYADPDVNEAVVKTVSNGSSSSLNCPEEVELAELLCDLHPWADMVRYARSGGEAMAMAVRIARTHTEKDVVAFCGYHGWHDWYLAANLGESDGLKGQLQAGLQPNGVPSCLKDTAFPFMYNDLDGLKEIVKNYGDNLAAIVMEPIRHFEPTPEFMPGVMQLAKEVGAVLIVDEISAGFRLASGGAHLKLGLTPDIAVFSKAIGNGFPIAAVVGREDVMQAAQISFISSTMWTERVGPTAALATIKKHLACNVSEHLCEIGRSVKNGWKKLAEKHKLGLTVCGLDPVGHFSFTCAQPLYARAFFVQEMLERGFLATDSFYAMYAHKHEDVVDYLEAVDEVFALLSNALDSDKLNECLKGDPAVAGFTRLA